MHHEVIQYLSKVKRDFPAYFKGTSVLDVGSLDVNGTNRWAFHECKYIGIDLQEGPNVTTVQSIVDHAKTHEAAYHVVVCTEMLEHDKDWSKSMNAMLRCLKSHGLLIITCAGPERPEHGTHRSEPESSPATNDFYRNLCQLDFMEHFGTGQMVWFEFRYGRGEQDCYFCGVKR